METTATIPLRAAANAPRGTSEARRILAAGCVGYLLCVWQAFCLAPRIPALPAQPEKRLVDLSGPAFNAAEARRVTLVMLEQAGLAPGEVRGRIQWHNVRQPVDLAAYHPDDPDAWAMLAELSLWGKSRAVQKPSPVYTMASVLPLAKGAKGVPAGTPPGHLAARFESGPEGAACVGHTPSAGTSYGVFQIASGTPTYSNFLRYLKERAPDLHSRLAGRGPADTGGVSGAVPDEWRRIASEHGKRFERLQYDFIMATHYRPALSGIYVRTGLDVSALSPATREVLLSTAVQHGPGGAMEIFRDSLAAIRDKVVEERQLVHFEKALIEEVYSRRLSAWGTRPLAGRGAMAVRYVKEKSQALGLLDRHYSGT